MSNLETLINKYTFGKLEQFDQCTLLRELIAERKKDKALIDVLTNAVLEDIN